MQTADLIVSLAADVKPVRDHFIGRRLAFGVLGGCLIAAMLVILTLGIRPDLQSAMLGPVFWLKWAYTLSLSGAALVVTARLARPDMRRPRGLWLIAVPTGLLAATSLFELATTPSAEWLSMWLGHSWRACAWRILALSLPVFAGLLWAFRSFAPTRLRAAGAAAGLSAGAFAASVYCLHCPEVSATFMLTWYSLGILFATSIGALAGPRLLRW